MVPNRHQEDVSCSRSGTCRERGPERSLPLLPEGGFSIDLRESRLLQLAYGTVSLVS